MANHGPAYGFSAEVQKKLAASYDHNLERSISQWVTRVTGSAQSGSFQDWLKSGVVLCNLANKILPGSAPAPKTSSMPFVQMENINKALEAFRRIGCLDTEIFMTVDLYEGKNMSAVLLCLAATARAAEKRGFSGARLEGAAAPPQVAVSPYGPGVTSPARSSPAPLARDSPKAAAGGAGPRFCPGCGNPWVSGARFCSNCGGTA